MSARRRNERCYDDDFVRDCISISFHYDAKKKGKKKRYCNTDTLPRGGDWRKRLTHLDLISARVLVNLEDRVVIRRGDAVVVGFLLRSRFTSTHAKLSWSDTSGGRGMDATPAGCSPRTLPVSSAQSIPGPDIRYHQSRATALRVSLLCYRSLSVLF